MLGADAGLAGQIPSLCKTGNDRAPPDKLEEDFRIREVCAYLRWLPPQLKSRQAVENGWFETNHQQLRKSEHYVVKRCGHTVRSGNWNHSQSCACKVECRCSAVRSVTELSS